MVGIDLEETVKMLNIADYHTKLENIKEKKD
jgi:hypothetical protein